jgi:predicted  nucleic acid-binding Zn-ribbon protein
MEAGGGSVTQDIDWISRSGLKAKGKRPQFLAPEGDRMLSMLMALVGEVSVMRERMDTIERLLDTKGMIGRADIENYEPDLEIGRERNVLIREYLARVMRGVQQNMQALEDLETPIEDVVKEMEAD